MLYEYYGITGREAGDKQRDVGNKLGEEEKVSAETLCKNEIIKPITLYANLEKLKF